MITQYHSNVYPLRKAYRKLPSKHEKRYYGFGRIEDYGYKWIGNLKTNVFLKAESPYETGIMK